MADEPDKTKVSEPRKSSSNEEIFGRLVFFGVLALFLAILGIIGFGVYNAVIGLGDGRESIVSLPGATTPEPPTEDPVVKEPEPATPAAPEQELSVPINVLNGGAAKGTAGVVADLLRTKSFTSVTAGNATRDYAGVTVYYRSAEKKTAAEAVVRALADRYPKAEAKPSDKSADTAAAEIVVIVGS